MTVLPAIAPSRTASSVAPPVVEGIEWVRPRPDARGYRADAILAVVLLACTALSLVLYRATGLYDEKPLWQAALWAIGMTLPLAFRRRWPELVAVIVNGVYVAGVFAEAAELLFSQIALFISIYTVGAWSSSRLRAGIVRGVIAGAMFLWLFGQLILLSGAQDYLPDLERSGDGPISPYLAYGGIQIITNLLFFGGAWWFGDTAYRSARARAALQQRTEELTAERERTRTQAVALERLRIARELHDVVAHHVSVMGVQAGAARRVLQSDPDAAAGALTAIEESARSAVDELHQLLGTLRDEQPENDSASTRDLDQLPALCAEATDAGLPTAFTAVGAPRAVPATVGLTAYRIAQEALTNARKHAGAGATADVRLRYLDDALELEVASTGAVRTARAGDVGGLGIRGMRERADAVGATLEIGPRSRGGWLVRVRFPLGRGS